MYSVAVGAYSFIGQGHEDREPVHQRQSRVRIVVAVVDGEFTVKRLYRKGGQIQLTPENSLYSPIVITQESDLVVWGVVTGSVRQFRK